MTSQLLRAVYAAKIWKVLVATFFMVFIWQTPVQAQNINTDDLQKAEFLSIIDVGETIKYSETDLVCLAKNIYYEAGAESLLGKLAVAQVTFNRTQDPKFGGTLCAVVLSPHQFSWTNKKDKRNRKPKGALWNASLDATKQFLMGKRIKGMERALYFHETKIHSKNHRLDKIAQIGGNIFYARNG